jgi:hypothetical protein
MSHTPGPWTSRPFGDSFAVLADDKRVCYCYGAFADWSKAQADANAHLVAAAPELLDAVGRALFHATLRGWATTEDHELREVYEQMKAAVRKAEGKQ